MSAIRKLIRRGEAAYHLGAHDEAALCFEEALHRLRRRPEEGDDSLLAMALNNLAASYRALGRQLEAEPLLTECLPLCKRVYGHHHLDVAIALNNLASLYVDLSNLDRAEALYLEALSIHQQMRETGHPNRRVFLKGLAMVYEAKGQRSLATSLREQAEGSLAHVS